MPRSRVRPPHEALKTVSLPCVDCGAIGTVRVERSGVAYLCPACLDTRVAQVQATPPPPIRPRGRKPKQA